MLLEEGQDRNRMNKMIKFDFQAHSKFGPDCAPDDVIGSAMKRDGQEPSICPSAPSKIVYSGSSCKTVDR